MLTAFLDQVTGPSQGGISPQRLSEALRVSLSEIARLAKVERSTLTHRPGPPAVRRRPGEIARIVTVAAELLGGPVQNRAPASASACFSPATARNSPLASSSARSLPSMTLK